MTVTNVVRDPGSLTLTITSQYAASPERVWRLWDDPRLLERWWGPPTYPATFVEHDLREGGRAVYFMTGPEGDRHHGFWRVTSLDAPRHLEFENGMADAAGVALVDPPAMVVRVALTERTPGVTLMDIVSAFPSAAAMERYLSMGLSEGMSAALGQTDALLDRG
ncbi:MAG: SRPBCC domain-containing protein [Acidobacteriota bacterium]|nr:SRPBCC domain-containing protein [Acidobacteriota bacterium]